jgi:hypothetical protein
MQSIKQLSNFFWSLFKSFETLQVDVKGPFLERT